VSVWFGVYTLLVLVLVGGMLGLSALLGERHPKEPATGETYEGGTIGAGSSHVRLSAKFYLIGMFFVVFDLEAVFIFAWAVAGRELGWPGYAELLVFVAVLLAALVYLWRLGALDWGTVRKNTR
jgi:NADH-quinone oxidoreductase subunit A